MVAVDWVAEVLVAVSTTEVELGGTIRLGIVAWLLCAESTKMRTLFFYSSEVIVDIIYFKPLSVLSCEISISHHHQIHYEFCASGASPSFFYPVGVQFILFLAFIRSCPVVQLIFLILREHVKSSLGFYRKSTPEDPWPALTSIDDASSLWPVLRLNRR